MSGIEEIAGRLSRLAACAARRAPAVGCFWIADRKLARELQFLGVIVSDGTADIFTDTGLAVRAHLQEPNDGR